MSSGDKCAQTLTDCTGPVPRCLRDETQAAGLPGIAPAQELSLEAGQTPRPSFLLVKELKDPPCSLKMPDPKNGPSRLFLLWGAEALHTPLETSTRLCTLGLVHYSAPGRGPEQDTARSVPVFKGCDHRVGIGSCGPTCREVEAVPPGLAAWLASPQHAAGREVVSSEPRASAGQLPNTRVQSAPAELPA